MTENMPSSPIRERDDSWDEDYAAEDDAEDDDFNDDIDAEEDD